MSGSYYADAMSKLLDEYNSSIAQAENIAYYMQAPSEEEYKLYLNAAKKAEEISRLNTSAETTRKQWERRAVTCQKKAIEIFKKLHPPVDPPVAPQGNNTVRQPANQTNNQTSYQTNNKTNTPLNTEDVIKEKAPGTYVTTKSGFKTRNSSSDVPADTIERWYRTERPGHSLDDVVGMDDMKRIIQEELLDNIGWDKTDAYLKIPALNSFLLYGPFGTGKSFFIEAVAGELMDKGFRFIQLSGADVHDSYVGVGEKVVKAAFQEAVDNAPAILYMDEFENMCSDRSSSKEGHEKRLSVALMEAYNILTACEKPVIFMAATNYPDQIEKAMISRIMTFVPVPLPSEEVRINYFQRKLKSAIHFGDDIDAEYMADVTDNYCFRDLDKIVFQIYKRIKKQAIEQFAVRDANGCVVQCAESDEKVEAAIKNGLVFITRELFDETQRSYTPEPKGDILASLEAFEKKT